MALHSRDILMSSKADGIKSEGQMVLMEKVFHGSSGFSSVIDAMMEGKGFYGHLFQKVALEINRQGNEHRTNGFMLELLPMFHLHEGARFMVHDKGFTRKDLSVKKASATSGKQGELVAGRNLADKALTAIANYKLALKYHDDPEWELAAMVSFEWRLSR